MARGRKPIPNKLKLIKGTLRPGRVKRREAEPLATKPRRPGFVGGYARAEWRRISKELFLKGLLTELDRGALTAYCCSYARFRQAEEELIAAGGLLIKKTNGDVIVNPLVNLVHAELKIMQRFLVEFGMTPSARASFNVELPGGSVEGTVQQKMLEKLKDKK